MCHYEIFVRLQLRGEMINNTFVAQLYFHTHIVSVGSHLVAATKLLVQTHIHGHILNSLFQCLITCADSYGVHERFIVFLCC